MPDSPSPTLSLQASSPTALSALLSSVSRRWHGALLWVMLVLLLAIALTGLWWLTWQHEQTQVQEATDLAATTAAADVRQRLSDDVQALQQLLWTHDTPAQWSLQAEHILREHREIMRVEQRGPDFSIWRQAISPLHPQQFSVIPRGQMSIDAEIACAAAWRLAVPTFSRSYYLPTASGLGAEVVDLCLPQISEGPTGNPNPPLSATSNATALVVTVQLSDLLHVAIAPETVRRHEILLVEADGTRLARVGHHRGAGVFVSERLIDTYGFTLPLRLNSTTGAVPWIPNLNAMLVLALSVALAVVVMLLVHDMRRRNAAEQALAEALVFRQAMEDSLVTGLRARSPQGRITYVNPAFCHMVGYSAEELLRADVPPYWPPDMVAVYRQRQIQLNEGSSTPPREGHETVFIRRTGERFPVLIFEAPLIDGHGRPSGWMSTVLDISAQRRAEELSRQQQDKLQAAARLATMGEMATLLSHELNQPLAAIASYASGSLNLMPDSPEALAADLDTQLMIRQAVQRIAEQAERAGRVIRSVHQFVRRRERLRENVRTNELLEAILPLIRLAARRSNTRIELDIPNPPPRVSCDRTMVEQVLLNLARNGLQAMESVSTDARTVTEGVLSLEVRSIDPRWVSFTVIDQGCGIPAETARHLFTPFFTTKPEGMGIGLAMCRTVIEQHGGALDFAPGPQGRGTAFRFTLPSATISASISASPLAPSPASASSSATVSPP